MMTFRVRFGLQGSGSEAGRVVLRAVAGLRLQQADATVVGVEHREAPAADIGVLAAAGQVAEALHHQPAQGIELLVGEAGVEALVEVLDGGQGADGVADRKSTRLNSSHVRSSYAVFCS